MSNTDALSTNFMELTAEIVRAYVAKNSVQASNLPALIASVHTAVVGLNKAPEPEAPIPAVNPKRSVHHDYIVCLEDGKKFKSLKRHLMTHYALTPVEYRGKWGLAADYPMVAPSYAAKRSALALKFGLGRNPGAKAKVAAKAKATAKVKRAKKAA